MKEWTNAEIEEFSLAETAHGGKVESDFDDIYVNADGKWEGTFAS